MLWEVNEKRLILEWGLGGEEEKEAGSDQASLKSYCLSWFLLTVSRSLGQVNGDSPSGV